MTKVPVPGLDALGELANEAAANARRLLTDADILIRRRRWPTAHSLAILAFEEAGKAWLCVNAMLMPDEVRPEFPLGEFLSGHLWKLTAARGMADMLAFIRGGPGAPTRILQAADVLESLARADNQAKQRGLYADYEKGAVWSPSKVGEDEAKRMVSAVRDVLDYGGPLASPEFIAWLARLPDDVRPKRDEFFGRIFSAAAKGDYESMVSAIENEYSGLEGFREMLEEDARHLAQDRATLVPSGAAKAKPRGQNKARRKRRRPRRR